MTDKQGKHEHAFGCGIDVSIARCICGEVMHAKEIERRINSFAALEQRVEDANKLLDDAGIEHSGRTLDERVREVIEERDTARRIAVRIKKAYAAEEEA